MLLKPRAPTMLDAHRARDGWRQEKTLTCFQAHRQLIGLHALGRHEQLAALGRRWRAQRSCQPLCSARPAGIAAHRAEPEAERGRTRQSGSLTCRSSLLNTIGHTCKCCHVLVLG